MTEHVSSRPSVKVATPPCAAKAAIPCGLAVRKQHEILFAASKFESEYNEFYGTNKSKFIKENMDEAVFMFALFKCRKFDKRRN